MLQRFQLYNILNVLKRVHRVVKVSAQLSGESFSVENKNKQKKTTKQNYLVKIVALNVPQIFSQQNTKSQKSKVRLVLELPLCSFVSLESSRVIADDRVAGDLYNSVQSRG